ncbi:hypothetical protein H4Q26_017033 [Puccinia striiformis f. sp. tritici PST-130]|uniref:Fe2OG dioxygenase domain-containing protein n=1 Tax=Puccinia striiformis f. sp. tritici PST-78 TaxID=1165861 RepID=A0A0L0VSM3_9BASI|nr:hypothetical protein H4Q26_017033 [Puccinia striiformis f. sp. tritici PST-130]KNF02271.1 hypothetical protein PSTG_04480 [Puccinia striiformis f. sp. tritici PST-78]
MPDNSPDNTSGNPGDGPSPRQVSDLLDDSDLGYDTNLRKDLTKAFETITTPGTFAAWEALPTTPPTGLHVDGIGEIAMPLGEEQVRQLIEKSHQAPYGRRSETLVDVSVRNTWQINGDQLSFHDPAWQAYLLDLSKRVATSLGINGPIQAELYKMLIYEKGAMFKPHTDTEKIPGMFGTMIICLPSAHTGGEVVVTHNGECKTLKTSDASQSYACWYSDVTHEVLPVKSGYRCVLTFNLAIQPGLAQPAASVLGSHKELLRKTLKTWLKDPASCNEDTHLYYALDHEYTQASISIGALKAEDFARVQAAQDLTAELPFVVFLALLEKGDTGDLDSDDGYITNDENIYEYPISGDGPQYTLAPGYYSHYDVRSLHALDGTTIAGNFDFNIDMCLQEDPFLDLAVTRESFQGHTGNDGPEATHWYRRSALLMIPKGSLANYLADCSAGDAYHEDKKRNILSVLSYLGKTPSLAPLSNPVLDALNETYKKESTQGYNIILSKSAIKDVLQAALQHSHYELFQTLDALPAADRAEKYNSWIPLLIRGYSSSNKRLSIIAQMSDRTRAAAVADGEARSDAWAEDLIRECNTL